MLTEADRKYLAARTGKQGAQMQIVFFCLFLLWLFIAFVYFSMGGWIVNAHGYSFGTFLSRWGAYPDVSRDYSGVFVAASLFMTKGLIYFLGALFTGTNWWTGRRERERSQRIVNTLKRSGDW